MSSHSISNQADANRATPGPADADWTGHEHITPEAQREAQKLVSALGSPELAKAAVDRAAEAAATSPDAPGSREEFAKKLGFISYLDLFEASTPSTARDGTSWMVTQLPATGWVVWNERELDDSNRFATREAAMAAF